MNNNDLVPGFDNEKDENLKIKLQDVPDVEGCLVLVLHGYIDTYNSTSFQNRVQRAIDEGFIRLIFNCNGLSHVSSTGIGSFTVFLKAVKSQGGDIILLEVQPKIYEVLQLLGFSQFFNIQTDLNESIDLFRSNEPQQETEIFPKIFACPFCSKSLKAVKPGRFRCSDCKTIIAIDNAGAVSLG
ncbi:MAG: STAS domain-containing protein [Treponema sp.]|jgi:anti-anti-sigma factor|nr:STAS domain-containing protein [Treponema sp.]